MKFRPGDLVWFAHKTDCYGVIWVDVPLGPPRIGIVTKEYMTDYYSPWHDYEIWVDGKYISVTESHIQKVDPKKEWKGSRN